MLLEKIRLRRTVADKVSESEGIGFRAALRLVDNINSKATPDQLAAASDDLPAGSFAGGLLDEQSIHAVCCASGVAIPVHAVGALGDGTLGDGTFLKWLFSDEGRVAFLKWAETVVKIIAILAPLFA